MRQDIKKLLGLQNIWVDSWNITASEISVHLRSPRTSSICPSCSNRVKRVHQYHTRRITHSIWQERTVRLYVRIRRFYCTQCKQAFTEYIPGVDQRKTTDNFRRILLKELSRHSLSYVKQTTHISASILYTVLHQNYAQRKAIRWDEQGKQFVLGIDEHSYRGRRLVATFTNITKRTLLEVGQDDRLTTVAEFLKKVDKQRVSEVCIDMKRGYLNVIQQVLPGVKITVDKFHVVAYANKMVDLVRDVVVGKGYHVRKILLKGQEKLTEPERIKLNHLFLQFKHFPALYQAYFIKEKLRDFYRLTNKKKAIEKLTDLIMFCQNANSNYLISFGKTLVRWKENILNYFDHYSTNAFTEGVHTKIKMIKRVSFGFRNVHNYIAKVSLAFVPLFMLIQHTIC